MSGGSSGAGGLPPLAMGSLSVTVSLGGGGKRPVVTTPLLSADQNKLVYDRLGAMPAASAAATAAQSFSASPGPINPNANIVVLTVGQLTVMLEEASKRGNSQADQKERAGKESVEKGTLRLSLGTYEGEIKDGKPHGKGKCTFFSTDVHKRKDLYGTYVNGTIQGYAVLRWHDGMRYVGEFVDGDRTGIGQMQLTDGTYLGYFVKNQYCGYGIRTWNDGSKYEGMWADNTFHGPGVYKVTSGTHSGTFSGNWEKGLKSGQFESRYDSGNTYIGMTSNGKYNGFGKYYFKSGDRYEGDFVADLRHGNGTEFYFSGEKFQGTWKNDKISGVGTYYIANGTRRVGNYVNGLPEGEHICYPLFGENFTINFVNGKEVAGCCTIL
jgi:hypothetical protein